MDSKQLETFEPKADLKATPQNPHVAARLNPAAAGRRVEKKEMASISPRRNIFDKKRNTSSSSKPKVPSSLESCDISPFKD